MDILPIDVKRIAIARSTEDEILKRLRDAHQVGDGPSEASAAMELGEWYLDQGRPADAVTCFQLSFVLCRQRTDDEGCATALFGLGKAQRDRGQLADAARCFTDSADHAQACGNLERETAALAALRSTRSGEERRAA